MNAICIEVDLQTDTFLVRFLTIISCRFTTFTQHKRKVQQDDIENERFHKEIG
ncbi:hypothetical protein DAPPUDRAFT_254116 [Daphnia pulex]|uniref:Uncharacterized protein n=1 Tax=Daphnia pulex TaxID=6669 RepID=E9H6B2_DAPPU|nr:hypothetical protein DAPPUDRAFT_254116 [Daphnia pulex]|eukprot:EFX72623.1 hypothetical protein DAPPUDRAFT_254116 [Daphnia pulex]